MISRPTPIFSIITVCYNAAATIEDTIQSVISQTYHHTEYIIVDGGSKDGTMDIVRRYANRIARIISEPDSGLYDAMNKGLRMATGDYVCFLNAGDEFHEDDTLQLMVHSIKGDALPDIMYGETEIVDRNGHFLRMRRHKAPEQLDWKSFRQGMMVCHQAFFCKRSIADEFDLRYRYSSDFDWCIRQLKKAQTTHNTLLIIIDYLDEGMTTRNRRASLIERLHIMAHHYGWPSTIARHLWFVVRLIVKR